MSTRYDSSSDSSINPQLFQRYQIKGEINKGGMGVVYRAYDSLLRKEVALKVMLSAEKAVARDRFDREARVLSSLSHPNIPRITDYGISDKKPYIAMDLIEGKNLQEWIEKERRATGSPPSIEWLTSVLAEVADALAYCHEQGFTHRDVKPSNIVIASLNDRPMLVDFGIVKRTESATGTDPAEISQNLTLSGEFIGSPAYMSPEQLCEEQYGEVGPPTDVWAFGTTLYFCLTGEIPFAAYSTLELYAARLTEPAPLPIKVEKDIPNWLSELSKDCQEIELAHRPSMAEVAERLRLGAKRPRKQSSRIMVTLGLLMIAALAFALGSSLSPSESFNFELEEPIVKGKARVKGSVPQGAARLTLGSTILARKLRGDFNEEFSLPPGTHTLRLVAEGEEGPVREQIVIRDVVAPKISIQGQRGPLICALGRLGRAELIIDDLSPVTVEVDGQTVLPDPKTGRFELSARGGQKQSVRVTDAVGHLSECQVLIFERGQAIQLLDSLKNWDHASKELLDAALEELQRKLDTRFRFRALKDYQCGREKHKIASFLDSKTGIELQLIPGGSVPKELKVEASAGKLVKALLVGRFELTRSQWSRVAGLALPATEPHHPKVGVSIRDIESWLEQGQPFRLPTVNEWLWAASGGARSSYPWGQKLRLDYVWCRETSSGGPHSVFEHSDAVNAFGLSDVLGNAWEWCQGNTIQGLSWFDSSKDFHFSMLTENKPDTRSTNMGFRVVCDLPE